MTFAEFIEDVIRPMFPGVLVETSDDPVVWRRNSRVVFERGGIQLRLREDRAASEWFTITRRQVFDPSEKKLVEHLVKSFARAKRMAAPFLGPLEETITRTAIAASVSNTLPQRRIIAEVLKTFSGWATQTYEGTRVSAGVVVTNDETLYSTDFTFENTSKEDFAKTLSDGIDSWWVVGSDGAMFTFETAPGELAADEHAFYPLRYAAIAQRSRGGAVGIALNRNGEILVFVGQKLRFAKRRGTWIHFAHESIIKQMSGGGSGAVALRRAIYQTCLDASFARSGACIGLLRQKDISRFRKAKIVAPDDRLGRSTKLKPVAAAAMIKGEQFASIPRQIRKELMKLDGALVLYPNGWAYAAGAILKLGAIDIGNQGGRSAAAKTLSHFGIGIKVSEDGMITGYKKELEGEVAAFKIG